MSDFRSSGRNIPNIDWGRGLPSPPSTLDREGRMLSTGTRGAGDDGAAAHGPIQAEGAVAARGRAQRLD